MNIRGATRYIPHAPDRILDAPEIVDDYCTVLYKLNLDGYKISNNIYMLNRFKFN